jgi:hypothetical protein
MVTCWHVVRDNLNKLKSRVNYISEVLGEICYADSLDPPHSWTFISSFKTEYVVLVIEILYFILTSSASVILYILTSSQQPDPLKFFNPLLPSHLLLPHPPARRGAPPPARSGRSG